ncbi:MAG: FecR protein [Actinobacteria bacterium]|nr:FecR protein [Actinomycetota bacterium]
MKRIPVILAGILVVLAVAGLPRQAPAAERDAGEEGFSAYSVARLKVFNGTAWVRLPDSGEWEEYATNTPIPERSRINVPAGSEAELQFHGGQYVLLTGGAEVDVRKFDEEGTAFRLRSGEIRFDLPADDFSPVGVAVPGGGKTNFPVPGRYWLTVRDAGGTRLVVRSGEGTVSVESGNFSVKAGEEAAIGKDVRISAYRDSGDDRYQERPPMTDVEKNASVPPAAAYELRDYGEWVQTGNYGYAWRPRVAAGWSPFYYGSWVWVSPYGWTWVSNEPWGWYPYHYGWWASDPVFGWVWSPYRSFVSVGFAFGSSRFNHFHRNTFFFPATVRFVRDGGFVRWVPLRPGERFVRSGFTRSNARLSSWERPLPRGTVFVRNDRSGKNMEWRDWSAARGERRNVVVRERAPRQGGDTVRRGGTPPREERPGVRIESERVRPEGQDRKPPGRLERPERQQQREPRGREGRSGDGTVRSGVAGKAMETKIRPERARTPRTQAETRFRQQDLRPGRPEPTARDMQPKVVAPPPYRGEVQRQAPPAGRVDGGRTREVAGELSAPAGRRPVQDSGIERRGGADRPSSGGRGDRDTGGDTDRGAGGRGGRR